MLTNIDFRYLILLILSLVIIYCLLYFIRQYIRFVKNRKRFITRYSEISGLPSIHQNDGNLLLFETTSDNIYSLIKKIFKRRTKKDLPEVVKKSWNIRGLPVLQLIVLNILLIIISINIASLINLPAINVLIVFSVLEAIFLYRYTHDKSALRNNIDNNLPEILDIMARVYRVHSDLRIALEEVVTNIADNEVKKVFDGVIKLSKFGFTIEEALDQAVSYVGSPDFEFTVEAIKINAPIGGNLPILFERISEIIRLRKEASDQVKNLMFESKVSAVASSLLVPAIVLIGFLTNKDYKNVLILNPVGRVIFIVSLIWWLIGVYIIRKSLKVKL